MQNCNSDWEHAQRRIAVLAKKAYDWAIKKGIAKEQARKVLPEGITKTTLYMNGTLRSWLHYIDLRGANGTQKEHMDIAACLCRSYCNTTISTSYTAE